MRMLTRQLSGLPGDPLRRMVDSLDGLGDSIATDVLPSLVHFQATGFFRHSNWLVSNAHVWPDESPDWVTITDCSGAQLRSGSSSDLLSGPSPTDLVQTCFARPVPAHVPEFVAVQLSDKVVRPPLK